MRELVVGNIITDRSSTSVRKYFNDIHSIQVLTPDEEFELSIKAFNGDENAREKLIKHNLRFVISVAKQYETYQLKLEDLINEGNLGLVIASTKFDPTKGFKFLSYAVYWIRRHILSYIAEHGKTIRLPNNKINILSKLKNEYALLEQKLSREPSFDEMLREVKGKYTEEDIIFYFDSIDNHIISLDNEIGHDGSSMALYNFIQETNIMEASHFVDIEDTEKRQKGILALLDKKLEREVIKLIYGLDGQAPLPLKTIGFLLGITSERVRQLRDESLEKLKNSFIK